MKYKLAKEMFEILQSNKQFKYRLLVWGFMIEIYENYNNLDMIFYYLVKCVNYIDECKRFSKNLDIVICWII